MKRGPSVDRGLMEAEAEAETEADQIFLSATSNFPAENQTDQKDLVRLNKKRNQQPIQ